MTKIEEQLALCRDCAREVYGHVPPSPRYTEDVAMLLAGTAATESGFEARRQSGFGFWNQGGAWGLWQTEAAPLKDSVLYLRTHPAVLQRSAVWLWERAAIDMDGLMDAAQHGMEVLLHGVFVSDALACFLARVHYLRFSAPVPHGVELQGAYYKQYYNTSAGKGSAKKFMADFGRLVEPWK